MAAAATAGTLGAVLSLLEGLLGSLLHNALVGPVGVSCYI